MLPFFDFGMILTTWHGSPGISITGSMAATVSTMSLLGCSPSELPDPADPVPHFIQARLISENGLVRNAAGLASQLAPDGTRVNQVSAGTIYVDDGIWAP